jgi:putative transposase
MAELLDELGVCKSHSRPRVSNDNPYSEAHFKTLKYRPDYPSRFESIQAARAWCREFFGWYSHTHYHSGIGYLRPADLHVARRFSTKHTALTRNALTVVQHQPPHQ